MKYLASLLLAAPLLAAACSSPTGSTCPPTDPPTYATFGQQFFSDYCTGCHSSTAMSRHGAPGDQNYDTEAQIRAHADDIDSEAASGPDATNTDMPDLSGPVHDAPSVEERKLLGQYLACLKGH
jgi:mono/diheme cytochrome c family protein